jgi:hypothetical protein
VYNPFHAFMSHLHAVDVMLLTAKLQTVQLMLHDRHDAVCCACMHICLHMRMHAFKFHSNRQRQNSRIQAPGFLKGVQGCAEPALLTWPALAAAAAATGKPISQTIKEYIPGELQPTSLPNQQLSCRHPA